MSTVNQEITIGVTLLNYAKEGKTLEQANEYIRSLGYSDEWATDKIFRWLYEQGATITIGSLSDSWNDYHKDLSIIKHTPFATRIYKAAALALVTILLDGRITIDDLPRAIQIVFEALKNNEL